MLRDIRHVGPDAEQPGGGQDGNLGHILTPDAVAVEFLGNPRAPVRPMPRFLRIVTGDAKAVTKGPGAARAHWTCSGTPDRASATHYPLCPAGQLVQRVGEFPSCWNGADLDSDTHRTHVTFPDPATGACPAGTVPIPRLRITLSYRAPAGHSYAVDTLPRPAAQAGHRPLRLREPHAGGPDEPGHRLPQRGPDLLSGVRRWRGPPGWRRVPWRRPWSTSTAPTGGTAG